MATLPNAVPEANCADCSESRPLHVNQGLEDGSHQAKLLENKICIPELSSFQIRHFVSTVRGRDFSKCWPFRQEILEKCLTVGLKPFLPPFDPPPRGYDHVESEHEGPLSSFQQVLSKEEMDEFCEESREKDCTNGRTCDPAASTRNFISADQDIGYVVEAQLSIKQSDGNLSEGTGMVEPFRTEKMLLRAAVNVAVEKSQDESENNIGTGADTVFSGLLHTDQVGGTVDLLDHGRTEAHASAHLETICTQSDNTPVEAKDSNFQSSGQFESECRSIQVLEADFSNHEDGAIAKVRQEHKGKFRLLSNECSVGPKQADFHNLKPSKIVISGKACQNNSQPLGERLSIPDQATVSCVEPELVGLPSRVEKSRNCEDSGFTGLNLDSLIPQVCPVCLNFTSTSNTALNAHIDHCLESVLPGDKGEARACKSKTKPRRMRSMVDICAAAPVRTLEDLESSSRRWVLNDEISTDDYSSCLGWRGGVVRRQPRTSLYRGPAWKGKSILEGEDIPHVAGPSLEQKQQQPEKARKKDPVAKSISQLKMLGSRSSTSAIDAEVELEESCKNQQIFQEEPCIPGPLRSSHVASSMHTGKPRMRKKKKSGSLNLVSVQDIPSSGACCQLDEEQADHSWSGPLDLLGFTPVDTSADEEKRLQQKLDCPQGQDSEVDMCEQQGSVEGFLNRPGKTVTKHSQNSDGSRSLVVTNGKYQTKVLSSDSKHFNEALMKRKLTQIDFDWILDSVDNSAVEGDIATEMYAERPLKNKRIAPKIKSLGTLVETPCKDKDKDGFGELGGLRKTCMNGLQELTSDQEVSLIPMDGPSSYQGKSLKRKCLGGMKGNTKRGSCDRNKHARLCPSKQHLSSHNLDSYNSSEHLKSPKDSSFTLGRAVTEHTAQAGMYSDSLAACPVEEMPQCTFVKDFDYGNVTGEQRISLMSRMYKDQTGGKNPRGAVEQRNIMHANTSKQNPLVQVPPCDSDQLRLVGNGTADCESSFEALRKEFSNTTSEETCLLSMEEALKERSNATSLNEQAVRINLSASPANKCAVQTFTGCNPIASVGCFATVNDLSLRDDDGQDRPQLLSTSQKPLFTEDLACFQSVDSLRASQMAYDFTAAPEVSNSVARSENQNPASLSSSWSENSQFLAPVSGIKMIKNNGQVLASAERLENLGISMLKPLTEHGIPHVSLSTSDLCERIGVNSNQSILNRQEVSILGRRNIFSANKSAQNRGHVSLTEGLKRGIRAAHGTMDENNILSQSLHDNPSPRILTSELGPVVSPAPGVLSEDSHNLNHEGDALDYAPMLSMSTERMSLPSDLLADFARTMAGNSTRAQNSLPPKHCVMNDQQSMLHTSLKRTPKDLHIGREYLNLMPLQGIANSSHTSVNGGNVQPHFLQTALQARKGSTSTTITDRVNPVASSTDLSGKLCNSSPNPRICGNLSSGRINGRRESLSGAELTSSLNGYRTVECSGDQGVVHIFGNPVFKLMGQNVIVTNNNIKSLGMENPVDQNGAQSFHPSNSIRHLGLLQETHSQYPQTLSQDIFSSSRLEAWHGDGCKPRNRSFMMDNMEIHPHALKSLPLAKFGHMEASVYKETAIIKPPISVPIPGERSRVVSSSAEIHLKKQAFVNNVSKPPAEVSISDDSLPNSNTSIPAILSRGRGIVTQQNGKPFTAANFLLSGNEPQLPSQTLTLQSTSSAYLADIHKLGVSGSSTLYGGNQRSGTLADIVQNSERSNS